MANKRKKPTALTPKSKKLLEERGYTVESIAQLKAILKVKRQECVDIVRELRDRVWRKWKKEK